MTIEFKPEYWMGFIFAGRSPEGAIPQGDIAGVVYWFAGEWHLTYRFRKYLDHEVWDSKDEKHWRHEIAGNDRNKYEEVERQVHMWLHKLQAKDIEMAQLQCMGEEAFVKFTESTKGSKYWSMKTMSKEEAEKAGYSFEKGA